MKRNYLLLPGVGDCTNFENEVSTCSYSKEKIKTSKEEEKVLQLDDVQH